MTGNQYIADTSSMQVLITKVSRNSPYPQYITEGITPTRGSLALGSPREITGTVTVDLSSLAELVLFIRVRMFVSDDISGGRKKNYR